MNEGRGQPDQSMVGVNGRRLNGRNLMLAQAFPDEI
jgi:hypothetical protein